MGRYLSWSTLKIVIFYLSLGIFFLGVPHPAYAQVAVDTITANYEATAQEDIATSCAPEPRDGAYTAAACATINTVSFGNGALNNLILESFEAGNEVYFAEDIADVAVFNRVANNTQNPNTPTRPPVEDKRRDIMFFERNSPTEIRPTYEGTIEDGMLANSIDEVIINQGIDNVFANVTPTGVTDNNIERVDYIFRNGIPSDEQDGLGFLVLDRGNGDDFGMALIIGIDNPAAPEPEPTAYAPTFLEPTWGTNTGVSLQETSVFRRNRSEAPLDPAFRPSHQTGAQNIAGAFFPIENFNPPAGATVFGYSLFPGDVDAPILNLNPGTVILTTDGTSSGGGLDLIAGGASFRRRVETTTISGQLEDLGCEPPLELGGITVQLLFEGNVISEVQTNANGEYLFDNVVANRDYTVRIDPNAPIPDTCRTQDEGIEVTVGTQPVTNVDFAFRSPAFSLLKRITDYVGGNNLPDFTQVVGNDPDVAALDNLGLGQGVVDLSNIDAEGGDTIEYTIYYINTLADEVTNVEICDRIPAGTTYAPDTIQTRGPGNPVDPAITDLPDGDAFIAAPTALPPSCGSDSNERGAVVVDVGTVEADQAGFIRFRVTVD